MIRYEDYPTLFSIVFGEGIANDAVCIILFNTVELFLSEDGEEHEEFTWVTPFEILGNFLLLSILSLIIGIIFGILCSLMLKHCRFLT